MLNLQSTTSFDNSDQIIKAIKPSAKSVSTKTSMDDSTFQSDPYTIKANILRNLDENVCMSNYKLEIYNAFRVCLTHDEKFMIIASIKDIIIVDFATKKECHKIKNAHSEFIKNVVVTKENILISCARDGKIKMWDLGTKQLTYEFHKYKKAGVSFIALNSNDKYLIAAGETPKLSIRILDLAQKTCIAKIYKVHTSDTNCIVVTKDDKYLISCSADKSIKIWNFGTWTCAYEFKNAHFASVLSLKLSKDDTKLYSSSTDGSIAIWDLKKAKNIFTFISAHTRHIWNLALINNDRFIISASLDSTVSIWDTETKLHLHTFTNFDQQRLLSVITTKNERYAIILGKQGTIYMLDFGTIPDKKCFMPHLHKKMISGVAVIDNNTKLVTGSNDGSVCIWDMANRELLSTLGKKEGKKLWSLCVSPDETKIATGNAEGVVEVWSVETQKRLFICEGSTNFGVSCIVFTKDGSTIITGSHDWGIYIRDANSPKLKRKIGDAHKDRVYTIDVTNDGQFLISGAMDKAINIWDLEKMKLVYSVQGAHDAGIFKVKLTNDNRFVISGSNDKKIKVWDTETMRTVYTFESSLESAVRNIVITSDDRFMIALDRSCKIEIYNLNTKQRLFIHSELLGSECFVGLITSDNSEILFSRDRSVYKIKNPFNALTVQYSDEASPYSLFRFMPLTSYFLNSSISHKQDMIKNYSELKINPHGWNWFHITAIFAPNKDTILACFENQIPFVIDIFGKTPLHYLFENAETDIVIINLVLSRFGQILDRSQRPSEILESLSSIFFKILELDNLSVASFLRFCLVDPEPTAKEMVDIYGKIKRGSDKAFYPSKSKLYSSLVRENLITYSHKQKVSIKILPFSWNYLYTKDDMKQLINTLLDLSEQEIFKTKAVNFLVSYLWKSSTTFYYLLGILFSIQTILISVYTGLGDYNLAFEIPIFITSIFFLIYEIFEMASEGVLKYLKSGWNYYDILGTLLIPSTIITIWAGVENDSRNWLFSFVLAYSYIRWISYFRVYHKTRKLIRMISEIIKDIASFALVLASIIFGLSLIFLQFDRDTPYNRHLLNSYRLLYSDFDLEYLSSPAMMFYFVIVIAIVAIVLLNMLITLMAETFAAVQQRSVIVDSKEKLALVAENMKVWRALSCILPKRKARVQAELQNKYLFIAEKMVEDKSLVQESLEDQINFLKGYINNTNEQVFALKKKVDEQKEFQTNQAKQAEEQIFKLEAKLEEQNQEQKQQGKEILTELAKIVQNLKISKPEEPKEPEESEASP